MGIGNNIRNNRIKANLTQKDLAERLNVTAQAVSRWENEDVEPSIDTIKQMASIFNLTIDQLLNGTEPEPEPEPEAVVVAEVEAESTISEEQRQEEIEKEKLAQKQYIDDKVEEIKKEIYNGPLVTCKRCSKDIPEKDAMFITEHHRSGRTSYEEKIGPYCYDCQKEILAEKAKRAEETRIAYLNESKSKIRLRRILGYVLIAVLVIGATIFLSITSAQNGKPDALILLVPVVLIALECAVFILGDTGLRELFGSISGFGIRMPGIIFSADLDGLKFLIIMKIIFFIIGILISVAAFFVALAICGVGAIFMYPYYLVKSYKHPDDFADDYL